LETSNIKKRCDVRESFDGLKKDMDDACTFLRGFTLGRRGFTQRDGAAAINRLRDLSERLQKAFTNGKHGKETTQAAATARCQILAANARLDLLRR
jgi:hypothetical protein